MKRPYSKIFVWDAVEAVIRGKSAVENACIKKGEIFWISNLTWYHKNLEKEKQTKPKAIRKKKIIIRPEIFKNRKIVEPTKSKVGSLKS